MIRFLLVAAHTFAQAPHVHKVLLIFSDMRRSAPPLEYRTVRLVPVATALRTVELYWAEKMYRVEIELQCKRNTKTERLP